MERKIKYPLVPINETPMYLFPSLIIPKPIYEINGTKKQYYLLNQQYDVYELMTKGKIYLTIITLLFIALLILLSIL